MGDHQDGAALIAGQVQEQLDDLASGLAVERRGRLVGEHQPRSTRQRPGDPDPLFLPAGQLGRIGLARSPTGR